MWGPSREELERAAAVIRAGGLVAFPTETVYGLGADALNPAAVRRIYEAKRRPRTSPLIVHVGAVEQARELAARWDEQAELLAARFWPGPLTLVVEKAARVPDIVTAGLETVGLRMPAHPVALELIRLAGVPVAAPSANPFMRLSPTRAEHIRREELVGVEVVLDGGATQYGIESTVLSLVGGKRRILRHGAISQAALEEVAGNVEDAAGVDAAGEAHRAPGRHARHYSPRTPVLLWARGGALPGGKGVVLTWKGAGAPIPEVFPVRELPAAPAACAAVLYDVLHQLDAEGWEWIAVELPPDQPDWQAVRDRLIRAAGAGD